jgi:hypothetical protein
MDAAPAYTAPTDAAPQEVRVTGSRRKIGAAVVTGEEAHSLPGAFGDPLRTVDLMPGIVPVVSGLPFFYVRGAPPGNTGYFIDGVRVPLVFHLALGPSVVHPGLIDHMDFYPGAYPARLGRFIGGIVDAQTRRDAPEPTVQGNLRLLDVGGLAETPFDGAQGSALVAGRFGYPGLLLPLFAPDTRLSYWDYQTRVRYRVGEGETCPRGSSDPSTSSTPATPRLTLSILSFAAPSTARTCAGTTSSGAVHSAPPRRLVGTTRSRATAPSTIAGC